MGDITKIEVWQLSCDLSVEIYKLTFEGKLNNDFSYRDQMRRAAISVPSNIAEGAESGFDKLSVRYFYNAKASLAELKTQLLIAFKISYINNDQYVYFDDKIEVISKKLRKLINYRKQHFK
jgi:four helix bundle protein